MLKIIGWALAIVFIVGLLVITGVLNLIFRLAAEWPGRRNKFASRCIFPNPGQEFFRWHQQAR